MKRNERAEWVFVGAVLGLVTAWLFAPLWIGALRGEPRFFEWDVPEQYWPDLVYLCRSLDAGELPLWNPYDRGGYPYYADPQAAMYHPVSWAICALGGPSPGLHWQELRVVFSFFCTGFFGFLWLRRLGLSVAAATLGAVLFESAPFMRHNWELNLTTAIGFFPMVLWSLERVLKDRRVSDAALLAFSEAMLIWSGSPPAAWFAGTFTAIYAGWRIVEVGQGGGRRALVRAILLLGLAACLTVGLAAAVLVPGLTLSQYSVQAGRSYESISEGAIRLSHLTALITPRDGNHLYVGLIAWVLVPLAWWRATKLPGRDAFALGALIAVLLTLGDEGPLFKLAFEFVPGVRMFRLPHRYEVWLGPCFAALAGAGFDSLREKWAEYSNSRAVAFPRRDAAWLGVSLLFSLFTLVDVSRRLPEERHTRPRPAPGGEEVARRVLPLAPATESDFRYMDEFGISCRSGTRLARRDFRGYQDPLLLHSYERVLASLREHPALALQFNVRYALTGPHFIHGWDRHFLPPPEELMTLPGAIDRGEGVIELGPPLERVMPLAYFVAHTAVVRVESREEALEHVIREAPAPIAVLEGGRQERAQRSRGPVTRADVITYETDRIELELEAPEAGVLVVNEAWYPGWRAWVSGQETPVFRANSLVRAVEMPRGRHRIELRFEPPDGVSLRWLLVSTLIATIALMMSGYARSRKT